jgi:hypothetical protein
MDTFASNMKAISARLLMLIASSNQLDVLTGDIKNAHLCAKNKFEFHVHDNSIEIGTLAEVDHALYGMPISANRWQATLSETLYSMGYKPSRGDGDVWMKKNGDHYDYIGTHTDDLLMVNRNPQDIMKTLSTRYAMLAIGPPEFHLGCDYKQLDDGRWLQGTVTHCKEGIKKVEEILELGTLGMESTPMVENLKPELDESALLSISGHRGYQQLVGIAQWLITCGRMDLCFAISSLSRFSAAPREGHLKALTRVFKYLKRYP